MTNKQLYFAVIALGFLGDTLLVEPMVRNLRNNYPNSKIIFIVDKAFKEVPLGFEGIDYIYEYDKKGKHKGLRGFLYFKKNFPFKNIDYAIITHPHDRSILLAKLMNAGNIISSEVPGNVLNCFITHKIKYDKTEINNTYKSEYNLKYLEKLCSAIQLYKPQYIRKDIDSDLIISKYNLPRNYIVFSPVSKDLVKDWDYNNIKKFIETVNKPVVLVGTSKTHEIAAKLINDGISFIDITNKTNITELGEVIKRASLCVSVDTGTFHFAYIQKVKTIGLFFYTEKLKEWTPANLDYVKILIGNKYKQGKNIICKNNISYLDVIKLF